MGSRGTALLFLNLGAGWEWVFNATPWPIYPRERPCTHRIGGWVGPRVGLDGCGKSRPHRDSIPGPSIPQRVAIPTELTGPVNSTPWPLYPRERPGTHCIGGWVGPGAGLGECGKSRPHRDLIPGQSSPQRVAIPTELTRRKILLDSCFKHLNQSPLKTTPYVFDILSSFKFVYFLLLCCILENCCNIL